MIAVAIVYIAVSGFRLGSQLSSTDAGDVLVTALVAGSLQVASNVWFDVYWRDWSAAALEDLIALAKSTAVPACALLLLNITSERHVIPTGAVLGGAGLVIVIESALKLRPRWPQIWRAVLGRSLSADGIIVVGAGRTGQLLARDLDDGGRGYRIACFADDDPKKWGTYVRGHRVSGAIEDLPQLIERHRPSAVVIAIPTPTGTIIRRVVQTCGDADVRVRIASSFGIRQGDTGALRPIGIEEFLAREPVRLDTSDMGAYLRGRTVLVTGAAGSIGSELSRKVAQLEPRRLLLVDTNESGLFEVAHAMNSGTRGEIVLGDIRDVVWLERFLRTESVDVVFHAAAYKHVPIMEENPVPGIVTNVIGTRNVLEAAAHSNVERFVFISSDKAVVPASVLGLTKRVGELLTVAYARMTNLNYAVVRFGNVLGSSGSVIPIFSKQIDRGGPVTVTHPEATRYFMTIDEAAGLVIEAGGIASPGDLLLLDMGRPIRILDLAEKMIRLRGLRVGTDIPIEVIGLRPGEKLHEELLFPYESATPTRHPRVMRVGSSVRAPSLTQSVIALVARIEESIPQRDVDGMLAALRALASVSSADADTKTPSTASAD